MKEEKDLKCTSNCETGLFYIDDNLDWELIWYWDHLKNFITEIPQGPLGIPISTIWITQKRFQGPPARGF